VVAVDEVAVVAKVKVVEDAQLESRGLSPSPYNGTNSTKWPECWMHSASSFVPYGPSAMADKPIVTLQLPAQHPSRPLIHTQDTL
jgi:hypothetical protein